MSSRLLDVAARRGADTAVLTAGTAGRISFLDERGADRDESGALVTSAINRSLLASAARHQTPLGILVTATRPRRRRQLALVFREKPDVIGVGGESASSDDDADDEPDDDDERAEPSEVLSPEERAFETMTQRNTDFNSISSNLSGTSRTLVDWVDESDRTTERSALTGRHKKFTPLVSVAPFSTGRGPGPVKVNPVAPMQNGELITSDRRRQEMVEKTSGTKAATTAAKTSQMVTRLDEQVTRLDDSPKSSGDEDDDNKIHSPPLLKIKESDSVPTETSEEDAKSKQQLSSVKASEDGKDSVSESKADEENKAAESGVSKSPVRSEPSSKPSLKLTRTIEPQSSDAIAKERSPEPMSNISAIKQMLAEKAAGQKGAVPWRSRKKVQEKNLEKLNCLDGVSKSTLERRRSKLFVASTTLSEHISTESDGAKLSPQSGFPPPDARSETSVCGDAKTKPDSANVHEKAGPATSDKNQKHLPRASGVQSEACAERSDVEAGGSRTETGSWTTPDSIQHKPVLVGDKLSAKPENVRFSHLAGDIGSSSRRLSLETGIAGQATTANPLSDFRAKVDTLPQSFKHSAALNKPDVSHSKRQTNTDGLSVRLTKNVGDEMSDRAESSDDSQSKISSYSPKSSLHRDGETKTQRAFKREQELERKREELEKRNREEKKSQEPSEPAVQSAEPEEASSRRRDAPQPDSSPASCHNGVSGFHSQLHSDVSTRSSRDKEPSSRPKSKVAALAAQRAEQKRPGRPVAKGEPPPAEPRSSFSTDSDDEDDDNDDERRRPPQPPQRTCSVSPATRRRGPQGVSFAPGTDGLRRSDAPQPRSQSVPRHGQLDSSIMNDDEVQRRLSAAAAVGSGDGDRRSRRDEPRSRGRFSLKKLLKFGRDEKRRDKDQVYGEFRKKPEIIHPIDRAGVGRVEVINRTAEQRQRDDEEQRRRRERLMAEGTASYDLPPPSTGSLPAASRLSERWPTSVTQPGQTTQTSPRASTGLTPEGRPKPPPPPPPSRPDGSRPSLTPPSRPPPPPHHQPASRSRDGWGRSQPGDTEYANLGGRGGVVAAAGGSGQLASARTRRTGATRGQL